MVFGLGTGSTAAFAVAEIGALFANGKFSKIVGVPTSKRTYEQALSLGIPLSTLDDHPIIDLAIDGADKQACMRCSDDEFASSDEEPTAAPTILATWPRA